MKQQLTISKVYHSWQPPGPDKGSSKTWRTSELCQTTDENGNADGLHVQQAYGHHCTEGKPAPQNSYMQAGGGDGREQSSARPYLSTAFCAPWCSWLSLSRRLLRSQVLLQGTREMLASAAITRLGQAEQATQSNPSITQTNRTPHLASGQSCSFSGIFFCVSEIKHNRDSL